MSDTKLDRLHAFFYGHTLELLGINPDDPLASKRIRRMYPTYNNKGTAPGNQAYEQVIYITITESTAPAALIHDVFYEENPDTDSELGAVQVTQEAQPWKVKWTCYGQTAYDEANLIQHRIFLDWNTDKQKAAGLHIQSPRMVPVRRPEPMNGKWVERWDFECVFHEDEIRFDAVQSIETILPPDINLLR